MTLKFCKILRYSSNDDSVSWGLDVSMSLSSVIFVKLIVMLDAKKEKLGRLEIGH